MLFIELIKIYSVSDKIMLSALIEHVCMYRYSSTTVGRSAK